MTASETVHSSTEQQHRLVASLWRIAGQMALPVQVTTMMRLLMTGHLVPVSKAGQTNLSLKAAARVTLTMIGQPGADPSGKKVRNRAGHKQQAAQALPFPALTCPVLKSPAGLLQQLIRHGCQPQDQVPLLMGVKRMSGVDFLHPCLSRSALTAILLVRLHHDCMDFYLIYFLELNSLPALLHTARKQQHSCNCNLLQLCAELPMHTFRSSSHFCSGCAFPVLVSVCVCIVYWYLPCRQ